MKLTRSQKDFLTKAVAIVLAFVAIVAVIGAVGNMSGDDDGYTTINPTYSIGSIDPTTGEYTEDECALYTKDLIECTGFKLYADFDSDIKYTVHFYDENEVWLACVENDGLNMSEEGLDAVDSTELNGATIHGIRICIEPQNDENDKISLFEKVMYANQLTVKITTEETEVEDSAT